MIIVTCLIGILTGLRSDKRTSRVTDLQANSK
jgi:hypothetical protein